MSVPQHLKQPKSLSVFFLTEMWERYGFYAIQAGLILFFTNKFNFSDDLANAIIGTFIAMVYITPIVGGFIADRFLGFKHTIILGGVLLFAGYALLSITHDIQHIYYFLGLICVGTGLLKANVSSLLGHSYEQHDPRRDSGFTIFYVGINLGTFVSMVASGFIIRELGWDWNFGFAAIGMVIGVLSFIVGVKAYDIKNNQDIRANVGSIIFAYFITCISIVIAGTLMSQTAIALWLTIFAAICCVCVIIYAGIGEPMKQKMRLLAILLLGMLHCVFWAIFFQMFLSFNLFINRAVNTTMFGIKFPPEFFMASEAVGVILFGFVFSKVWVALARTRFSPSTPMKFAISFGFLAIAMLLILISVSIPNATGVISPYWVIGMYLIVSFGELSISPIGLSMITRLSSPRIVGMMMGVWFFTLGIGGKLAGVIADLGAIPKNIHNIHAIDSIYKHAFLKFFGIALIACFIALALSPVIKRLIRGDYASRQKA